MKTTTSALGVMLISGISFCPAQHSATTLAKALPDASDLPGFGNIRVNPGGTSRVAGMMAFRKGDKLRVAASIMVFDSPAKALAWPEEFSKTRISLKGAGYKPVMPVPGKFAAHLFMNRSPGRKSFSIMAVDGRSLVRVMINPGFDADAKGYGVQRSHGDKEIALAHRVAGLCLDRLTAIGLTSRSQSSAPAAAKERMKG